MLGAGTELDPYLIENPDDLNNVRNNLTAHYKLASNIDMSGWGNFTPIGKQPTGERFEGIFDGNGKIIANLTINSTDNDTGLFGFTYGATIKNLGIENANVNGGTYYCGILAGRTYYTLVNQVYITGYVSVQTGYIGSFVGYASYSDFQNNHTSATVECLNNASSHYAAYTGGFAGFDSGGVYKFNYSIGQVKTHYNNGSGFMGKYNTSNVTNVQVCYWDVETSGNATSSKGAGLTTKEMQTPYTFRFYDQYIWNKIDGEYPSLKLFGNKLTLTVNAQVEPIVSTLEYGKSFETSVTSYLEPIGISLVEETISVNIGDVSVSSYSRPINAQVEYSFGRSHETEAISFAEPIFTNTDEDFSVGYWVERTTMSSVSPLSSSSESDPLTHNDSAIKFKELGLLKYQLTLHSIIESVNIFLNSTTIASFTTNNDKIVEFDVPYELLVDGQNDLVITGTDSIGLYHKKAFSIQKSYNQTALNVGTRLIINAKEYIVQSINTNPLYSDQYNIVLDKVLHDDVKDKSHIEYINNSYIPKADVVRYLHVEPTYLKMSHNKTIYRNGMAQDEYELSKEGSFYHLQIEMDKDAVDNLDMSLGKVKAIFTPRV